MKGFGLRVSQGGGKAFVLSTGSNRSLATIGRYPFLTLQEARKRAHQLIGERAGAKHQPPRMLFAETLALFEAEKRQKTRAATVDENKRLLTKYFPQLQRKAVRDITTDDITKALDKLGDTPGTAIHAFWAMRLFLRWCRKRRYIQLNPIEGLDAPAKVNTRERVLSDDELRSVWQTAEKTGYPFGHIVKLLILTGQRRGEIGSLQASWCPLPPLNDGVSTETTAPLAVEGENTATSFIWLPSSLTKNKKLHTFPTGDLVTGILRMSFTQKQTQRRNHLLTFFQQRESRANPSQAGRRQRHNSTRPSNH